MKVIDTTKYFLAGLFITVLFYFSINSQLEKIGAIAPSSEQSDKSNPTFSAGISEAELARLIAKSPEVHEYYSFDNEGLNIYASPEDKTLNKAECKIYYEEFAVFNRLFKAADIETLKAIYSQKDTSRIDLEHYNGYFSENDYQHIDGSLPLSGIKIALDPGHIGGDMEMAILEGKYVRISKDKGKTVSEFNEGNIALETAQILAKKLIALGAKVMLSRDKKGVSAFNSTYDEWLQNDFETALKIELEADNIDQKQYTFLKTKADKKEIFHDFFKGLEIKERARKINGFHPDLCIVMHYNVDEENYWQRDREQNLMTSTAQNYSMVFMPGAFLANELGKVEERIQLLRLLVTNDVVASMKLSSFVAEEFTNTLKVPAISPYSEMGYIKRVSVFTGTPGVFARNLALTRMIHAPVCYGEPLCQDNDKEFQQLSNANKSRIKEVADAYFNGIIKYFKRPV
ncbi:N-acetylmuramoyl-L-alanine amidase family protein [Chondrinema litorale]|uniref:N-acetylmuramoyl-L-alanine amidase family protein n=1 Tax=Chondrinema litorale TaxID=2994555 RepID=UPI002543572E|nr:N-acetylmuramoyl-L-alanine amidase [Chondrinema litorale]UZR92561.1 N-acetylmuramoyl-L-alanine amidase [Chondrinema litorale]